MNFFAKPSFDNHPCFSKKASAAYGRVHLPVAPHCNIQCNFCNRIYDCANENRPGVTGRVQSPDEAALYVEISQSSASQDQEILCAMPTKH